MWDIVACTGALYRGVTGSKRPQLGNGGDDADDSCGDGFFCDDTKYNPFHPLIATHARTDRGAFRRKRKAEKKALTDELQAKEGTIGELERKVAQLVTSARIKHERENRVCLKLAVWGL